MSGHYNLVRIRERPSSFLKFDSEMLEYWNTVMNGFSYPEKIAFFRVFPNFDSKNILFDYCFNQLSFYTREVYKNLEQAPTMFEKFSVATNILELVFSEFKEYDSKGIPMEVAIPPFFNLSSYQLSEFNFDRKYIKYLDALKTALPGKDYFSERVFSIFLNKYIYNIWNNFSTQEDRILDSPGAMNFLFYGLMKIAEKILEDEAPNSETFETICREKFCGISNIISQHSDLLNTNEGIRFSGSKEKSYRAFEIIVKSIFYRAKEENLSHLSWETLCAVYGLDQNEILGKEKI